MPRFAFTFSFYQRVSLNKMDASRSSSSSSQHYSVLLQTVSELRTDLEKTMIKIKNLEEQNQSLTTNYQVVKDELIQTRFKYNDTKESYLNAVAEKFEAERQHEAFMERLKLQLAEKTSEFDQIRDKLIPHDIDQLRIKVQEEHELKHKAQLQAVEHKFEQERSEHFATKRGYEKNKVEYETLIQHQQQEIQALRSNHEEVENELRERIVKLREQELAPVRDEKQRANRSQLSELGHIVELLREESKALKAERDEAIFAVEQAKSSHEETVAHLKSRLAVAEAARAAAEEQRSNLTVEGERKDAIIRSSRQSVEDLSARLEQALKQLAEAERVQSMLRDDHHKHTEALQTAMESERGDYQERTDSLTERLIEKEEALRRALREGAEAATRSETALADMRRTQQLEMQEARRKYVAIEVEVADLKNTLKRTESDAAAKEEQNRAELEALRGELSKSRRDKDATLSKLREQEQATEGAKRKVTQAHQDSLNKIQGLESSLREAHSKLATAESKLASSRESCREAQDALAASKATNARLEQRNAEHLVEVDALKRDFARQVESIAPSYREQSEKYVKRMTLALNKEKKRAEAYKTKALEAHSKVKTLSETLIREGDGL